MVSWTQKCPLLKMFLTNWPKLSEKVRQKIERRQKGQVLGRSKIIKSDSRN